MFSSLELDLSTVPGSSRLAVDTTGLLLATVTSTADSDVTTDMRHSVIKCTAEHEETPSSGDVSPACKVPKLTASVTTTDAGHVKPGKLTVF